MNNPAVRSQRWSVALVLALVAACWNSSATAQDRLLGAEGEPSRMPQPIVQPPKEKEAAAPAPFPDVDEMTKPANVPSLLKLMLMLTILSLAPSILIMTTCFIRFVVVMGLLRQALGTQQLPPNQVIISLCLFLTFMVMQPIWKTAYTQGIQPYADGSLSESVGVENANEEAWRRTTKPLRDFMSGQIERTGNSDTVWMLIEYQRPLPDSAEASSWVEPQSYDDVDFSTLASAYMLSELKTAFVIGFQVFLPFLIVDLVVSSILISMGMMMLPPPLISLPFKLLLFVLIDGWYLTVGMLLESVRYAI